MPCSFSNQFVTDIYRYIYIYSFSLDSISTDLTTNVEREGWEFFFEKFYMYKLERNINVDIQEKMKTVIFKSNNCDKDLLM